MTWNLVISNRAEKTFAKLPAKDQRLIISAFKAMRNDPFSGDIKRLHNERTSFRRRVGNYRLFFDVHAAILRINIIEIARRTSTTY